MRFSKDSQERTMRNHCVSLTEAYIEILSYKKYLELKHNEESVAKRDELLDKMVYAYHHLLTEYQKEVIALHVLNGFTQRQTAKVMGISQVGVHKLYKRALRILRKHLT